MKTKKGFNLRTIVGEHIIVAEGRANIDFSNIINMNDTAAYLWKNVQNEPSFTVEMMAELLTEEYEVDYDTALADAKQLAKQWAEAGIIEED